MAVYQPVFIHEPHLAFEGLAQSDGGEIEDIRRRGRGFIRRSASQGCQKAALSGKEHQPVVFFTGRFELQDEGLG